MTFDPAAPNLVPFPHHVGTYTADVRRLDDVLAEFPAPTDPRWRRYGTVHEGKLEGPEAMWGPATRALFDEFAAMAGPLGEMFGIPDLSMETAGGGYHLIPPGGHLGVHVDFNRSPDTDLYRRLNLLCYLNRGWTDPGGRLELHDDKGIVREIAPEFGTVVVFETSDTSWHGHPVPATRWRFSVAAYFFSPEAPPGYRSDHSTRWRHDAP